MRLFSSLASVLLTSFVACFSNNFMEQEAQTETSVNNTINYVHGKDTFKTRYSLDSEYDGRPSCGRTRVILTHYRREINDSLEDNTDDDPYVDKILGGNYATYGEFPWMANILYNNAHVCGGAIISEFWVISAAHCFYGWNYANFTITVGDHRLWYDDAHEDRYAVETIINHEQYRSGQKDFDIALLKIKARGNDRGIHFNNYVQPICLTYSTEDPPVDTPMIFSGWGWTDTNSGKSLILKKTILPVIPYERCKDIYPKSVTPNVFCAGYTKGDTDLCRGDSGGPAVFRANESFVLYGIGVFGTGCRRPNYPTAFSSVPKYRGWIDATINSRSSESERVMPVRKFHVDFVPLPG